MLIIKNKKKFGLAIFSILCIKWKSENFELKIK